MLLIATALAALQSPNVQKRLVDKLIDRVADKMEGKITFSSVDFQIPGTISLKDVLVLDSNPYTEDSISISRTSSTSKAYISTEWKCAAWRPSWPWSPIIGER